MPVRPFWFTDTVALAANGSGTARFAVAAGEVARFKKLHYTSTSTFNVTTIRDDAGQRYTNASADDPLTSALLRNTANAYNTVYEFDPPITVEGPGGLNIELTDTSGAANTVRLVVAGEKET